MGWALAVFPVAWLPLRALRGGFDRPKSQQILLFVICRGAGNGSEAEVAFFLCELALELSRVQPLHEEGCLPRRKHKEKIRETIFSLLGRIKPGSIKGPANMRRYIESVVREVKS